MSDPNQEEIRRKRLARLAGSEPPTSPNPEAPKLDPGANVQEAKIEDPPAPMDEDEQKAGVLRSQSSSQMDISNNADLKGSPDSKSNEDSGVENMEVDEKADSEVNTPIVERKEAEKRKRKSSCSEEEVLSILQTIFAIKLPKASVEASNENLDLPDTAALQVLKTEQKENLNHLEYYNELISDILTEVLSKMAKGKYPPGVEKSSQRNANSLMDEMTKYLITTYSKTLNQESDHKNSSSSPLCEALTASRTQTINYTSLVIQGIFDPDVPVPKLPHSPLHQPLLDGAMPNKFVFDLMETTTNHSWQEFKSIFMPLVQFGSGRSIF